MDEPPDHNATGSFRGNGNGEDSLGQRMFETALTFDKYYTPLLFLFGTLGNSLSLLVFCMNTKYRSQSASYYLSALAISDTGFLLNLLAVWVESVLGGVITSGIMCPLVMYLGQVTCFMSVYLTVAFSIERYVAVHYPLSRPRICTRSKAKKIIAALTAIALLAFSYVLVIAQVIELPPRREDYYDELYRDIGPTTRSGFNSSQEQSSELFSFPDEGKQEEKERMIGKSGTTIPSINLFRSFEQPRNTTAHYTQKLFQDVRKNCDPDARYMATVGESISPQDRIVSQNCSNSYGKILQGLQNFASGDSSEELYTTSYEFSSERDDQYAYSGVYICSVPQDYYRISEIANYLDSIVTLIIPFFLITFFNVRIAITVWKLKDQRQNIVATSTTDNINHHHSSNARCSNAHRGGKKTTTAQPSLREGCRRQHTKQNVNLSGRQSFKEIIAGGGSRDNVNNDECGGENVGNKRSHPTRTIRFSDHQQTNTISSSEGGSEENSEVDNGVYDGNSNKDNGSSTSLEEDDCGRGDNPRLGGNGKKMSSMEELKATSKFRGKSAAFRRFAAGGLASVTRMMGRNREQSRHNQSPSSSTATASGQRMRPELVVVRERGSTHHPSSNAAEVRVTKTLLLVSTVFVVLNLPAHAIRCAQFIQTLWGTSEGQELLQAAQPWTNILFNTNFAVNFLLYCVSGRNFRKSLRNIILRKFNKRSSSNVWNKTKKGRKDYNEQPPTTSKFGGKRNFASELQVTEIVELEDKREDFIYKSTTTNNSNRNGRAVNFNGVDEDDETM